MPRNPMWVLGRVDLFFHCHETHQAAKPQITQNLTVRPFGLTPKPAGSGNFSPEEEEGTVPKVGSAEGTQYLLQQDAPLPVFGQVVCREAALGACPDHNGITEIILSSHEARLALQLQSALTEEKASKSRLWAKGGGVGQSPAWPAFPQSPGLRPSPHSSLPTKPGLGLSPHLPCRAELGSLISEV